jgi:hypothetical protein
MAIKLKLPNVQQAPAGAGTIIIKVPHYQLTLTRIMLALSGTSFLKTHITDIRVKLGTRVVWSVTTVNGRSGGTIVDLIQQYKGIAAAAGFLTIDFSERDAVDVVGKEIGGYDMSVLTDDITIEIVVAGATAPVMTATGFFTPPQGNKLVQKLVYVPASTTSAGKFPVALPIKGSLLKRVYVFYNGTDWGATTNGNVYQVEVKKNGGTIFELSDLEARWEQAEYRKVPQSKMFVADFIDDNLQSGMVVTADAVSLEFNPWLTAADTLGVFLEIIDSPYNV